LLGPRWKDSNHEPLITDIGNKITVYVRSSAVGFWFVYSRSFVSIRGRFCSLSMETKEYDLVVIGGGPAGALGAFLATLFGKRVALVEKKQNLGGGGIKYRYHPKQNVERNRPGSHRVAVPQPFWS